MTKFMEALENRSVTYFNVARVSIRNIWKVRVQSLQSLQPKMFIMESNPVYTAEKKYSVHEHDSG